MRKILDHSDIRIVEEFQASSILEDDSYEVVQIEPIVIPVAVGDLSKEVIGDPQFLIEYYRKDTQAGGGME